MIDFSSLTSCQWIPCALKAYILCCFVFVSRRVIVPLLLFLLINLEKNKMFVVVVRCRWSIHRVVLDTLEPVDGVLAGIGVVWFGQSRQVTRYLDVEVER